MDLISWNESRFRRKQLFNVSTVSHPMYYNEVTKVTNFNIMQKHSFNWIAKSSLIWKQKLVLFSAISHYKLLVHPHSIIKVTLVSNKNLFNAPWDSWNAGAGHQHDYYLLLTQDKTDTLESEITFWLQVYFEISSLVWRLK